MKLKQFTPVPMYSLIFMEKTRIAILYNGFRYSVQISDPKEISKYDLDPTGETRYTKEHILAAAKDAVFITNYQHRILLPDGNQVPASEFIKEYSDEASS